MTGESSQILPYCYFGFSSYSVMPQLKYHEDMMKAKAHLNFTIRKFKIIPNSVMSTLRFLSRASDPVVKRL